MHNLFAVANLLVHRDALMLVECFCNGSVKCALTVILLLLVCYRKGIPAHTTSLIGHSDKYK